MQKLVWQNANGDSIDLTSGNYGITQWEGFSNASLNIQSQQVPFQDGAVFLDALLNQRELSVTLKMQDNGNLEERYRMRRELIHSLNPKLGEGYLIYTNDFISKRIKCVAQIPLFETHNSDTRGTPKASLSWTACQPYWEDLEETIINLPQNTLVYIDNNGDLPTHIKADIELQGDELLLRNVTTEKKINIRGSHSWQVYLDTSMGAKRLERVDYAIKYINGGEFNSIITLNEKLLLVGSQFITIDINGKQETVNVGINALINDVAYSEELGLYAVCGGSSSGIIYTSPDLKVWTQQTLPTNTRGLNLISYEDGKFKAMGYYSSTGYYYITSVDGINWVSESTTINKNKENLYINDVYVRVYGDVIQISNDNSTWNTIYTLDQSQGEKLFNALCYFWGYYYFVGTNGIVLRTNDLTNFEYVIPLIDITSFIGLTANENFVFAISGNNNNMYKSADCEHWTSKNIDQNNNDGLFKICVIDNVLIVTSSGYERYYKSSNNGETFTTKTLGQGQDYLNPYYDGTDLFLVGITNIYKSTDKGDNFSYLGSITIDGQSLMLKSMYLFKGKYYIAGQSVGGTDFYIVETSDFQTYTKVFQKSNVSSIDTKQTGGFASSDNQLFFAIGKFFVRTKNGSNWIVKDMTSIMQNYDSIWSCSFYNGLLWIGGLNDIFTTFDYTEVTKVSMFFSQYYNYGITIFRDKVICGGNTSYYGALAKYEPVGNVNAINYLSADSNMDFALKVGLNTLVLNLKTGFANAVIKYRQKYAGV